jgi:DnaJ-domain-containing protein 1
MAQDEAEGEQWQASQRLIQLTLRIQALEEAYGQLWEEHQSCPTTPPLNAKPWSWGGDAYAVLGVRADAEPEAIEGAYKALAKKYHPDRHPGDPRMEARMKAITVAYTEVLRLRGQRRQRW